MHPLNLVQPVAQSFSTPVSQPHINSQAHATPDWLLKTRLEQLLFDSDLSQECLESFKAAIYNIDEWFNGFQVNEQDKKEFTRELVDYEYGNSFQTGSGIINAALASSVKPKYAAIFSVFIPKYKEKSIELSWCEKWTLSRKPVRASIIAIDIILLLTLYKPDEVYAKVMSAKEAYVSLVSVKTEELESIFVGTQPFISTIMPMGILCWADQCCPNSHAADSICPTVVSHTNKSLLYRHMIRTHLLSNSTQQRSYQTFDPILIRCGEEFEYYPPLDKGNSLNDDEELEILRLWQAAIKSKLRQLNIPENECSICLNEKERTVTYNIGSWQARLFFDGWSNFTLPEVNVSPYRLGEMITFTDKKLPLEDIFNHFITAIAKELGLRPSSGHKHIDLTQAVGYNPEFFFRFLIAIENTSWLTQCFKTAEYSDKTRKYLALNPDAKLDALQGLLNSFNELLLAGYKGKGNGKFSDNKNILQLLELVINIIEMDSKYRPLEIPTNLGKNCEEQLSKADKGLVVTHPTVTVELRFFNTARTGREAIKISKLIRAWLTKIAQEQENATPLHYQAINPMVPIAHEKLKLMFEEFVESLGLEPEEYRELLWI
ncbi:hypothetical protein D5018_19910 [Parashewanella curva]|uniref:Uncharacterized protein n=1 Tax=Parashewanella curva TaxID=2338552 RepID=A0A3L8PU48_9GAMM|nr:hypothetical protein [Parashewanella curva]RLV57938.1 hypothetical protein D5018_19910 [Parashewanella curva]